MQNKTINIMQKKLDDLRFWNGKVREDWTRCLTLKEDESYYNKDQRRYLQLKIDYINEIQEQIYQLQEKQKELKKKFYENYNHHKEMSESI